MTEIDKPLQTQPIYQAEKPTTMDIDLNNLTAAQQVALRRLAKELTHRLATEFIFCFALQRYEAQSIHCFGPKVDKNWFRTDILLVYNDSEQRSLPEIHHLANSVTLEDHQYAAVVMAYSEAMQQLTNGDAFAGTVFQHGALLYSGMNTLPPRKVFVCHETLLRQTREGWRCWFNNSCQFMDCASYCLMEHKFNMAVFMVHQSVEQACKAMLKVMLYMRPNTHNLAWMLKLCSALAPEIASVFPRDNPENKALFNLLKSSYMDSRYAAGFAVNEEQAWALYYRASTLLRIAGELCNKRIAELEVWVGESQASMASSPLMATVPIN
ncbi:HEPN domain-containing protein [Parapedobacter sp. 10938]|uniref:HEPN domain-containing protein n=1 Tax=Parapedobacter flavus TaxID=3110225 RepID=UPI002DBA28F3|nr:HEPN domain-containing protein [Parapedobacter sp. 10938]MEC3880758.1 HEPN domain-containing protein [Parapedobacter sp. 10938]